MFRLALWFCLLLMTALEMGGRGVLASDAPGEPPAYSWRCGASPVRAVAFSPDGRTLAVGMGLNLALNGSREALDVQAWDVESGRRRHVLRQQNWDALTHPGAALTPETMSVFSAMAFLPNGRLAACTNKPLEVPNHGPVGPDGSYPDASYSEVRIWDVTRGTLSQTVTYKGGLESLAAPGGPTLLGLSPELAGLVRWDVGTKATTLVTIRADDWRQWGTPAVPAEGASGDPSDTEPLLCTRDGRTAARWLKVGYVPPGGREGTSEGYTEFATLLLWDVPSGRVRRGLAAGEPLAFSPDGTALATLPDPASATDTSQVQLWDAATGRLVRSLTGLAAPASVVFTPGGQTLAVGGRDGSLTLCPLAGGAPRHVLRAALPPLPEYSIATNAVGSVAVSPDGRLLAAGCGDGTVRVWRLRPSGKEAP